MKIVLGTPPGWHSIIVLRGMLMYTCAYSESDAEESPSGYQESSLSSVGALESWILGEGQQTG